MKFNKTIHEILKEVHNAKNRAERLQVLKYYSCKELKMILGYTYDPKVEWKLPEGVPPYRAMDIAGGGLTLFSEARKLYLLVDGPHEDQRNLTPPRRERIFIQMLESLDPRDARLLINMKDKKLPYDGLDRELVAEAYPRLDLRSADEIRAVIGTPTAEEVAEHQRKNPVDRHTAENPTG